MHVTCMAFQMEKDGLVVPDKDWQAMEFVRKPQCTIDGPWFDQIYDEGFYHSLQLTASFG